MPLVQRKRTVLSAIRDVCIAPFVFVLAAIYLRWWRVLLIIGMMLPCMWLAREPLASLAPTRDDLWVLLFCLGFVALAAIPLAIRDYFSDGGFETVWQRDDACVAAGQRYASLLIEGNLKSLYERFSEDLQKRMPMAALLALQYERVSGMGIIISLLEVNEKEIPYQVFSAKGFDSRIDAVVQIVMQHEVGSATSTLVLYLNCRDDYRIMAFRYEEDGTKFAASTNIE